MPSVNNIVILVGSMGKQDAEKVRQLRSHIVQTLDVPMKYSEIESAGGAFPFAKIYCAGERFHEVRWVPLPVFTRCGLAERHF
jgi:hypothetical protein